MSSFCKGRLNMMWVILSSRLFFMLMPGLFSTDVAAQQVAYIDGRPTASMRVAVKDGGVVLKHGDGQDSSDVFGAREAVVNKDGDTYYLFYDGAGKDGWRACLAKSKDLLSWTKMRPALELGDSTKKDAKSASSPWVIKDNGEWHMFYLGTPNTSPAPDRIPSFPYLTMKAKSNSIEGPWIKQYEVIPFDIKGNTFYSLTASPGVVIKYKDEFLQFFSGSMEENNVVKRTLGLARTKSLDGPWQIDEHPIVPSDEQVENSSLYYDRPSETWYLFTNHIGITNDRVEYTDAIWVYWTKDIYQWNKNNKAVVLDSSNCSWAKGAIGMPSVIPYHGKLAMLYDGTTGKSISHMQRDIGIAWITLPLQIHR